MKVGRRVYVTPAILEEFARDLPEWISVVSPTHAQYQQIIEMELDKGEASAIALSCDTGNSMLIIDDLKARKVADNLGLRYSGTFGLILKAKQLGMISSVRPILDKIRSTNFRFDELLFQTILEEAGE